MICFHTDNEISIEKDLVRWVIYGIELNRDLLPELRKYMTEVMDNLFKSLVNSHGIDNQTYTNHIKTYPEGHHLEYRNVNNNGTDGQAEEYFDYKIRTAQDLAKLFLSHPAPGTETLDQYGSSHLLHLLHVVDDSVCNPAKVTQRIKQAAEDVEADQIAWIDGNFRHFMEQLRACHKLSHVLSILFKSEMPRDMLLKCLELEDMC